MQGYGHKLRPENYFLSCIEHRNEKTYFLSTNKNVLKYEKETNTFGFENRLLFTIIFEMTKQSLSYFQ